jgi:SAM-dependent methyltransferase
MKPLRQFDFGNNWKSFSDSALTLSHLERARLDFRHLMQEVPLAGRSFLDIGFGQGLALCLAREAGATVYGNDIDQKCGEALASTLRFFPELDLSSIPLVVGSILDDVVVERLRQLSAVKESGGFDVVHSWGVLHHTGAMARAIQQVAILVRPQGHLVIAIYNRHLTSPIWYFIKRAFVAAPPLIQRIFIALFYPVIFVAKALVTRQSPLQKDRGMDFYHDVIDWIGGFPYEYASATEIITMLDQLGFQLERCILATVPTGCNQFVFRRR